MKILRMGRETVRENMSSPSLPLTTNQLGVANRTALELWGRRYLGHSCLGQGTFLLLTETHPLLLTPPTLQRGAPDGLSLS